MNEAITKPLIVREIKIILHFSMYQRVKQMKYMESNLSSTSFYRQVIEVISSGRGAEVCALEGDS
jgi:hypothetical protein